MADLERQDKPDDAEPTRKFARVASFSSALSARAPSPPAGAGDVGGEDVHLLDYVRVLYKRRWLAGTPAR